MAIKIAPKLVSAQPARVRPTVARTKPAIAPSPVDYQMDGAKRRGRPPSGKVRVTMLLDPAVIAKFKATGKGWQSRINDALNEAKV